MGRVGTGGQCRARCRRDGNQVHHPPPVGDLELLTLPSLSD